MSRRRVRTGIAAVIAAGAMILAPLVPAAADAVPVSSVDFEDGTTGEWTQSGGDTGTLTFVADPDDPGNQVLRVNDRDADFVGIESPTGLFTEGNAYTFSARVRLADDAPVDSASARFVVKEGYHWVDGSNATITKNAWTTITGTRTADGDDSNAYVGTSDLIPAAPYAYLVDDILITTETAPPVGPGVVLQSDFEGVDFAPWTNRGNAVLSLSGDAHTGAQSLQVIGRSDGWHGPKVDAPDVFTAGNAAYTISAWVKLVDGQAESPINVGVNQPNVSETPDWNQFPWVTNRPVVTDADWVQLTGTFTPSADNPPAELYIEAGSADVQFLVDDVLITAETDDGGEPPVQPPGTVLVQSSFDDGELGGWFARQGSGTSDPTVGVVEGGAIATTHAAQVSNRTHEGDGIQHDVKDVLLPGRSYALEAYVRFAPGADLGRGLTVSMRTVTGDSSPSFANLLQIENATSTGWTRVSGQFTVPGYDTAAELYFEARYDSGNTSTFLIDQVTVWVPDPASGDLSLTPIKDTVDFPVGVAIDQRETTGGASELLLHHFDQITAENHMKVENWYDAAQDFAPHSQAVALLDFAQQNELRLYGHVLVWHSQTPAWFFQDGAGRELTGSTADQQLLRERLRTHIFDIAEWISGEYGLFGSETNPLSAWDVVNEVVSDQATPDGLRPSAWYRVLGEEYIHLAFQYADEAFNETYAAPGTDRPVKLFINDYNTEQGLKGDQYQALIDRLLAAGVPLDGVGHQFHLSVNTPISALEAALDRFAGYGLQQAVTELDVTINPANEPNRVKQGHFYRDAFTAFRAYHAAAPASEKLYAVTVWGLTDNRSWRSEQQPLLFDGDLTAKPAYFGVVGDDAGVPPLINAANVFGGDVALTEGFDDAVEWRNLPENVLTGGSGGFQLRWSEDHLTVLVRSAAPAQRLEFTYGGEEFVYDPASGDSVSGIDAQRGGEHLIVARLPHEGVARGGSAPFDVRVIGTGGGVVGAWNSPGATGTLTFLEPLSFLEVPEAAGAAPTIDAEIDAVWDSVEPVTTATRVEGNAAGAKAAVRTLWRGHVLYALLEVADPEIDVTNSDPWNQDGVEIFVDLENGKNGSYGPNDAQFRVTVQNDQSFGTGNAAAQQARLTSATTLVDDGYIVEVAIDLTGQSGGQGDVPLGGPDTFHGIDFQVNDGRAGARYAVHTWAEPTGTGYQSTARWGVAHLVSADQTDPTDPTWAQVSIGTGVVEQGGSLPVTITGLEPGQQVGATLFSDPIVIQGIPVADASGRTAFAVAIPIDLPLGVHTLVITSGDLDPISLSVRVVAPGQIAITGAELPLAIMLLGAFLIVTGGMLLGSRRRPAAR